MTKYQAMFVGTVVQSVLHQKQRFWHNQTFISSAYYYVCSKLFEFSASVLLSSNLA